MVIFIYLLIFKNYENRCESCILQVGRGREGHLRLPSSSSLPSTLTVAESLVNTPDYRLVEKEIVSVCLPVCLSEEEKLGGTVSQSVIFYRGCKSPKVLSTSLLRRLSIKDVITETGC